MITNLDFYKDKKVLIIGHTGFKGSWLTKILVNAGADVLGYSLAPDTDPNLFELSGVESSITHVIGDIRDYDHLKEVFDAFAPEIVFHLAAQPIVRESYKDPRYTYETNVMGTVNVLECIRNASSVKSAVIITTDKVYRNDETGRRFKEDDILDGYDPYSNSKSCAELAVASYKRSFPDLPPISTARAGNVIGGGDFAKDRIIPDCVRAMQKGEPIIVRNPNSVRPYQHVLEPLFAYLMIAEKQYSNPSLADCYNIGPDEEDCIKTRELVGMFCEKWGKNASWIDKSEPDAAHEAGFLSLDSALIKKIFGWAPKWSIESSIEQTVIFSKKYLACEDAALEMDEEIKRYLT